jgi:FecR protein
MKTSFTKLISIFSCLIGLTCAQAAELKEARVTQVVKDVKLLPEQASPRPAALNDPVRNGTGVRTGIQSRSELTFTDQTITRLGANTIFSFKEGTRIMNLGEGAILFQVPKGAGGATIKTAAITAAITGTTGIGEFHSATAKHPKPVIKWFCLEGHIVLTMTNGAGQKVELNSGQMIATDGTYLPKPVFFDVATLVRTSRFFVGFNNPIPSLDLIRLVIREQLQLTSGGGFAARTSSTNTLASDIVDQVDQGMVAEETLHPRIPDEFGTPVVITSPEPYLITSATTISTDPTITTNGQTDFGKIWRGSTQDGPLSAFIFGSTSDFDTTIGFDAEINGDMGGAGFKFTSLQLTGNPTISTTNGQINLALIAVNGITSGGPGGMLTFAGLRGLLLATENGSIDLGPEISFSGLHDITFYARGSGSDLTLASDVSTMQKIRLYGEGNIQLNSDLTTSELIAFSGGDFTLSGGSINAGSIQIVSDRDLIFSLSSPVIFNTGPAIDLVARGDIRVRDSLEILAEDDLQTEGLNISLLARGNIDVGGDLSLTSRPLAIDTGALVLLTSHGNTTIGGAFTLLVDNSNGRHIGSGGNIAVQTGGNLAADSISAFINDRNAGSIDFGGRLRFDIGGVLSTHHDFTTGTDELGQSLLLLISTRNDGQGGGTIGSNVVLDLTAGGVSVGGNMLAVISTNYGGQIPNAAINFNVLGNLIVKGNAADANTDFVFDGGDIEIQNTALFDQNGNLVRPAGTIGSNATVTLKSDRVAGSLFLGVRNNGAIGAHALVQATVTSNLSTAVDGSFNGFISNRFGGAIRGNATVSANMADVTTGDFATDIFNGGGTIGGSATINDSVAQIEARTVESVINNNGGSIGGNAIINSNVSGNVHATDAITFEIRGSDGAALAGINLTGGSYDAGGTFLTQIDGNGQIVINNTDIGADVLKVGVLGSNGTLRIGGGSLSGDTELKLYAPGSNGSINFVSNVTLSGATAGPIIAANKVTIFNGVIVTIGGTNTATVFTNIPNYTGSGGNRSTTGTFAGAGATTQPLSQAPPFSNPPVAPAKTISTVANHAHTPAELFSTSAHMSAKKASSNSANSRMAASKPTRSAINIGSSAQLLSLLEAATPNRAGEITIPSSKSDRNASDSSRPSSSNPLKGARQGREIHEMRDRGLAIAIAKR